MEQLIQTFADDYFGKVYYFCLKRVSDTTQAEDLAADIAVSVVAQLRKGVIPAHFSAWVWQIARNRYAAWAARKQVRKNRKLDAVSLDSDDTPEIAVADDVAGALIRNEDIRLLRRELAFISAEYRDIIVAYYLDYRKISNIAQSLNLPEGTVKAKLFRSRKILKEGMEMAREFGVLSYKPENVAFTMSSGNSFVAMGEGPWPLVSRKICKNILLAAYRTPSTAEELAVELGVALPYLEEEIDALMSKGLLRQNGRRYETAIFIISSAAQDAMYEHLREIAPELTKKLIALLDFETPCHEGYQPLEDMKWAMLMREVDWMTERAARKDARQKSANSDGVSSAGYTIRPDGLDWDLLGLEFNNKRPLFVGQHNSGTTLRDGNYVQFSQFKFNIYDINTKTPEMLTAPQVDALAAAAMGNTSAVAQHTLDELVKFGYLAKTENIYKPTFYVTFHDKIGERTAEKQQQYDKLFNAALEIVQAHYDFCRDLIYREIPDFLKKDQHVINFSCSQVLQVRGAVVEAALESGYISYAEGDERIMLGAHLVI